MNIEKFEIMQSIQDIIDNSNENKSIDKLIDLRDQIHNADRLESKFSPNAYIIDNLRNKKLKTDTVSGISTLTERNI
tara:strand:- start:722 stop:952 length:231 start_codon:yes stop_codon:yes gene_type:complete